MLHQSGFGGETQSTIQPGDGRIVWNDGPGGGPLETESAPSRLRSILGQQPYAPAIDMGLPTPAAAKVQSRWEDAPVYTPSWRLRHTSGFSSGGLSGSRGHGDLGAAMLRMGVVAAVAAIVAWGAYSAGLFRGDGRALQAPPLPSPTVASPGEAASPEAAAPTDASVGAQTRQPINSQPVDTAQAGTTDTSGATAQMPAVDIAAAQPVVSTAVAAQAPAEAEPNPLDPRNPRWGTKDDIAAIGAPAAQPQTFALAAVEQPAAETSSAAQDALEALANPPVPVPKNAKESGKRAESAAKKGSARVTAAVNLRSGPDNGNEVVAVVPANAPVNVLQCKVWCKIAWNGRQGYVFKKFVVR